MFALCCQDQALEVLRRALDLPFGESSQNDHHEGLVAELRKYYISVTLPKAA